MLRGKKYKGDYEVKFHVFMISRTQTENFIRPRYGKMWHLNEYYPYFYKTNDGN